MISLSSKLISLPFFIKFLFLIFFDVFLVLFSLWLSFVLRLGYFFNPGIGSVKYTYVLNNNFFYKFDDFKIFDLQIIFLLAVIVSIPVFIYFNLYKLVIRYIDLKSINQTFKSTIIYSIIWGLIINTLDIPNVPNSIFIINFMVCSILLISSRILINSVLYSNTKNHLVKKKQVVIVGAGEAGRQIARGLKYSDEFLTKCFVDTESHFIGRTILGIEVRPLNKIESIIKKNEISDIIIALDENDLQIRNYIFSHLKDYSVRIRTLPSITNLITNKYNIENLNKIEDSDLLNRDINLQNFSSLNNHFHKKVVFVSGAGGSIGTELCRQILLFNPSKIILFELNEHALYNIVETLKLEKNHLNLSKYKKVNTQIIPILGSVLNYKKLETIFIKYNVNSIFHSAAYKHVPLVENNPSEGIMNNVFGTLSVSSAAISANVSNFLLVSTDKAVRPTNVMGATKRFAELIIQSFADKEFIDIDFYKIMNIKNKTHFKIVRFGNVIGSSGSVVPLFEKQIKMGGPITVTDKNVTRYLMSIKEAVQLILQVVDLDNLNQKNAGVYILDMGQQIKIIDLAKKMIERSGFKLKDNNNPYGDIEINIIGLRPGEKLYEELLLGNKPEKTSNPKIMRASEAFFPLNTMNKLLKELAESIENNNTEKTKKILIETIDGYKPTKIN